MRYLKTIAVELQPNGREYKLQKDVSIINAEIVSVTCRRVGHTKNGLRIASEVFDSAALTLKVEGADVLDDMPLAAIENYSKALGCGFPLCLKNIDWTGSMLKIQNPSASVENTAIELIFEYDK